MNRTDDTQLSTLLAAVTVVSVVIGIGLRLAISDNAFEMLDMLGYFTIQSNIAVLAAVSFAFLRHTRTNLIRAERFYAAICVYIVVTGFVYQTLLGPGLHPTGLNRLVLSINHGVTPLLYFSWYIFRRPTEKMQWRDALRFLPYPAINGIFAVVEGAVLGPRRHELSVAT